MNRLRNFIIALGIISVFLYCAHFTVYQAILLTWGISGSWLLVGILAFLGVSLILSLVVGMRYYNFVTRIYYRLSMIWLALMGYLFIASALIIVLYAFYGARVDGIGKAMFALIVIGGIYGLVHARKIALKSITVTLKNLPESWQNRKMVWVSDQHVGQIHGKKSVAKVVAKIQALNPDIVFIGGDLFDGSSHPKILENISPFKNLKVPLGIYYVTGNHECYGNSAAFLEAIKQQGITVLTNQNLLVDGVQVIGVDYLSTAKEHDFQKVLSQLQINRSLPSILLKHEPRHLELAELAGISIQFSGHTHRAQQWPFEYFARLVYGRFVYDLQKLSTMQVFTSSGTGTWGPPFRLGTMSEIVECIFTT
jgi:predicted MPP superfamily phosphohydrolase